MQNDTPMKIDHLGAKDCVTGSCHLMQVPVTGDKAINILVDCGKAQGNDPELPFDEFPVAPEDIDCLFLTHAHIDHIGRVPDLIEAGFEGEIIATHGTKALLAPMLKDSLSFTGKGKKEIRDLEEKIDELSWGFEYGEVFSLKNGIEFKLGNAGHILGSCFVWFKIPGVSGQNKTILFSGDLGCTDTPILPDPDVPDACDLLILESTYGDRNHESRKTRVRTLKRCLERALGDGGIVYIPAFSLGRTQELIYELDRIGMDIPVFIDSPLGLKITKLYSDMDEFWDKEAKALAGRGDHPIDFKSLYSVKRFKEHKMLLGLSGPAVIIAGSGMCTGGRIVDHFKHGLDDPKNDVFFVGYQARGTRGRKIIEGKLPCRAGIYKLSGYSAHADQAMLVNWVKSMPKPPGQIHLVHGGSRARNALAKALGI